MKISADVLRRFVTLPDSGRELRMLLDDIGVEVKRHNTTTDHFTLESVSYTHLTLPTICSV